MIAALAPAHPDDCSGRLIRDLLRYFKPEAVFDPMTAHETTPGIPLTEARFSEQNPLRCHHLNPLAGSPREVSVLK